MTINTLTGVEAQVLELALDELRPMLAPITQCSNTKYESVPGGKRSTVEIPIPIPRPEPYDIVPGHNPKEAENYQAGERQIILDRWKGLDFSFDDKEMSESGVRHLPMAMQGTVISLANYVVKDFITVLYKSTYGSFGTVGTIPFSVNAQNTRDTRAFTQSKKILENQFTPMDDGGLKAFLTTDAKAEAMELRAFQDVSWNGQGSAVVGNAPQRPFGFEMFCPQVMPRHVAGTAAGYLVNNATGLTTDYNLDADGREVYEVAVDGGTGDFNEGDIINFAGDDENYVVRGWNSTTGVVTFLPKPRVAIADNSAVTIKYGDHDVNLLFHRNSMAYVTRPMKPDITEGMKNLVSWGQLADPQSGIVLAMETSRQYNQTYRELKLFYGLENIRHEFAMRLVQ